MSDVKKEKKKYYNNKNLLFPIKTRKKTKSFSVKSLPNNIKVLLISIGAFTGGNNAFVHSSQYPYLLGFKNNTSFYNVNKSNKLLLDALKFLRLARRNIFNSFVVVGSPRNYVGTNIVNKLNQLYNVEFFSSTKWKPGTLSRNRPASNIILILFNPTLHNDTLREAVYSKIPIVSFVTPFCDIRGIDYPVTLNLKEQEAWYLHLIFSILSKH